MSNEKRIYKQLDELSNDDIQRILDKNDINEMIYLPLSVAEYHPNWKYAQDLCVKLSEHPNSAVRSNAILGLSYVAEIQGKLEKHVVKPVLLRALKDAELTKGRAADVIGDINLFLGWNIGRKSLGIKQHNKT